MLRTPSFFIFIVLFAVGCSLYQSEGRKDFESRGTSPGTVHLAFENPPQINLNQDKDIEKSRISRHQVLKKHDPNSSCHSVNSIQFWLKNEFSPETHELLYSSEN